MSSVIVTSSPTRMPPVSSAAFQASSFERGESCGSFPDARQHHRRHPQPLACGKRPYDLVAVLSRIFARNAAFIDMRVRHLCEAVRLNLHRPCFSPHPRASTLSTISTFSTSTLSTSDDLLTKIQQVTFCWFWHRPCPCPLLRASRTAELLEATMVVLLLLFVLVLMVFLALSGPDGLFRGGSHH
jgi:hypothetical protein